MIEVTRLNGSRFVINPDLIKFLEEAPDTVLTLVTGEKLVVRESSTEIMRRILRYRRAILEGAFVPQPRTADSDGEASNG